MGSRLDSWQMGRWADIGIALYISEREGILDGKNLETLGFSSGKIAYYLKAGLPVITNLRSGMGLLIAENRCGVCIDAPAKIGQSVVEIAHNYEEYSTNAQILFNKTFDFKNGFMDVLSRLNSF